MKLKFLSIFQKNTLMVNSGSSALTLAAKVLKFNKNDEIIIPFKFWNCNFIYNIEWSNTYIYRCDINTLQIKTDEIEKISKKTKALLIPI